VPVLALWKRAEVGRVGRFDGDAADHEQPRYDEGEAQ
jgi:hypothetical protein